MKDKLLRYTLRIDRLLFRKFRYVAEWEGRSANREIEQYIKKKRGRIRSGAWEDSRGKRGLTPVSAPPP